MNKSEIIDNLYPQFRQREIDDGLRRARIIPWLAVAILTFILAMVLFSCDRKPVWAEEIDLSIIAKIESNNNPLAYNSNSGARGLYQITQIRLDDYIKYHQLIYINPESLYDPIVNKKIAEWYLTKRIPRMLKWYKKPITIENILWSYNAGIGLVIQGIMPEETRNYIKKYNQLARKK